MLISKTVLLVLKRKLVLPVSEGEDVENRVAHGLAVARVGKVSRVETGKGIWVRLRRNKR